ncbi:hypothetical protein ACOMHN_029098 [Nucella lapillus]
MQQTTILLLAAASILVMSAVLSTAPAIRTAGTNETTDSDTQPTAITIPVTFSPLPPPSSLLNPMAPPESAGSWSDYYGNNESHIPLLDPHTAVTNTTVVHQITPKTLPESADLQTGVSQQEFQKRWPPLRPGAHLGSNISFAASSSLDPNVDSLQGRGYLNSTLIYSVLSEKSFGFGGLMSTSSSPQVNASSANRTLTTTIPSEKKLYPAKAIVVSTVPLEDEGSFVGGMLTATTKGSEDYPDSSVVPMLATESTTSWSWPNKADDDDDDNWNKELAGTVVAVVVVVVFLSVMLHLLYCRLADRRDKRRAQKQAADVMELLDQSNSSENQTFSTGTQTSGTGNQAAADPLAPMYGVPLPQNNVHDDVMSRDCRVNDIMTYKPEAVHYEGERDPSRPAGACAPGTEPDASDPLLWDSKPLTKQSGMGWSV